MQYEIWSARHGHELIMVATVLNRVLANIIVSYLASEVGDKFTFDIREREA